MVEAPKSEPSTPLSSGISHLRLDRHMVWIILWVAIVLTHVYTQYFLFHSMDLQVGYELQIVNGQAESPYLYRVLMPAFFNIGLRLGQYMVGPDYIGGFWAFQQISFLLFFFIYLYSYYKLLLKWFTNEQSLIGVLFVAVVLPVTFYDHFFQPWSIPEAAFVMLALLMIYHRKHLWLSVIVFFASLNRETAIIIPIAYFVLHMDLGKLAKGRPPISLKALIIGCSYLIIWLAVFLGLRWLRGIPQSQALTLQQIFAHNRMMADVAVTRILILFGPLLIFAVRGFRTAPQFWRRLILLIAVYLIPIAIFGIWHEVRLLMPILPMVVGLALTYLFPTNHERRLEPPLVQ
jgi:hypothetical protein